MKIHYGMTTRENGNMAVTRNGIIRKDGARNRKKFFTEHAMHNNIVCQPVHQTHITPVDIRHNHSIVPRCDGLITKTPNLYLAVTGADCFPLFFYDTRATVIGIAHAGWRGITKNIAAKMIRRLHDDFSVPVSHICAAIGPGIHACHFEIKKNILAEFHGYETFIHRRNATITVDLPGILRQQLHKNGIRANNILPSTECTYCLTEKYFSYRRDGAHPFNVQMAYAGLRNAPQTPAP